MPVSGSASSNITTTCAGGSIDFSATGTNVTGYNWYTNGGTPATSTNQNETVTYATAGNYTAYLVLDGVCDGQVIDSVECNYTSGPRQLLPLPTPVALEMMDKLLLLPREELLHLHIALMGELTFPS